MVLQEIDQFRLHFSKKYSIMRLSLLLLGLLVVGQTSAKNYFLLYDNTCMDRLEYSYEETRPGNEFVMYAIEVGNGEKIMLEVGLESRAPLRTLNDNVLLNCDGASNILQADLAEKVNNKIDKIYIVTPANLGDQYRVAVVNSASYFKYDGQSIVSNTQQYRFEYAMSNSTQSGDLSMGDPRGSVYYIENLPLGPCEVSAFRQTFGRDNNYMDIYVVPEIGIVEEKSSQANTSFRLSRINNTPFADYVYRICGQANASNQNNSNAEGVQNYNDASVLQRKGGTVQEAQPAISHIVKKGETLFAIAKNYEISLSDIKVWNNLSTDIIYPNDQLIVSPATEVQNYQQDFTTKGVQSYNDADAVFGEQSPNGMPAWSQTSGQHIVQSGETVQTIARMYGFTEERFRYFNQLAPSTRVKEGDFLMTTDCSNGAQGNLQSKGGATEYNMNPAAGVNTYGANPKKYEYTNAQNEPYKNDFLDFDRNYPDDFQPEQEVAQDPNTNAGAPDNYNYPPGFTAKSPQSATNENFYSPSNYGPVAGTYNNNDPLRNPRNINLNTADPTDYSLYVAPQENNQPSSYGAVPSRRNQGTTQTKGLSTTYDSIPLTGVKKMHTVKEGESLSSIAKKYGTTVGLLRALNQMNKNEIVIPYQQIYVQK